MSKIPTFCLFGSHNGSLVLFGFGKFRARHVGLFLLAGLIFEILFTGLVSLVTPSHVGGCGCRGLELRAGRAERDFDGRFKEFVRAQVGWMLVRNEAAIRVWKMGRAELVEER